MTDLVSHEQLLEFQELLKMDDLTTPKELATFMRSLGEEPSPTEAIFQIIELDLVLNGTTDFTDFLIVMARESKAADSEEMLKEAFRSLDKDQNGFIAPADLQPLVTNLGVLLTDEKVSYEKFKKIIMGAPK